MTGFITRHKISAKDYGKRFLKKARGPWAGSRGKGKDMFLVQVSIVTIFMTQILLVYHSPNEVELFSVCVFSKPILNVAG